MKLHHLKSGLSWLAIASVLLIGRIQAHEGHKPLPTKGVEVQSQTGTLVLSASARDAIDVKTAEISQLPMKSYLNAFGSLTLPWNNHALVSSMLEGRVVSVSVVAGDKVQAGQVVAQIESPAIEQIQKDIRNLIASIRLDQQLLQGAQEASKSGAIPAARLLEIQSSLFQNETAIRIAKAKWVGIGLDIADLDRILKFPDEYQTVRLGLKSPISGTVLHNDLTVGKYVNSKEHALEVIDRSSMWLRIEILEKDISKVRDGDPVEFIPTGSQQNPVQQAPVQGTIRMIEKVLDARTHVATAWVDIDNRQPSSTVILPGMTGQVRIGHSTLEPRILVPTTAVIRDGAERFVLVEQERTGKASLFKKIPLAIGLQNVQYSEVTRGELVPGDRVLTQGSRQLGNLFTQGILRLSPEAIQDIGLKTAVAQPRSVGRILSIDGIVSLPPSKLSRVSPQLSGKIHQILVDRGQWVRAKEPLALISSSEFQDIQLEVIQSHLEMKFRESILENIRQAGSSIPQRQRLEIENLMVTTRNQYQNAVSRLKLLGIPQNQIESIVQSHQTIEYYPVQAPIDGVVIGFGKAIGHIVSADEELFEIHDTSERLIEAFVSEKDAAAIQQGQTLRCRPVAQEGRSYPGIVLSSGQSLSNRGQTLSVWTQVDFGDDAQIYHNMLCRLSIDIPNLEAMETASDRLSASRPVVPLTSILQEGSQSYLFVALTDGAFERRRVSLGPSDDKHVVVLSGLESQETVVVQGVSSLQTGYAAVR